jgi:hypothetical protein
MNARFSILDFLLAFSEVLVGLSFLSSCVFCLASRRVVADLAEWLFLNRNDVWNELGRPGTFKFRGCDGNGYLARTSAMMRMVRLMPLESYRDRLGLEGNEFVERYTRSMGRSFLSLLCFFVVLALQLLRER